MAIPGNVVRGAEFLDEALGPEWDERINLRTLDLSSSCGCVLGQLFREHRRDYDAYDRGRAALGVKAPNRLGFVTHANQRFWHLTAGWKDLIRRRRAERKAA